MWRSIAVGSIAAASCAVGQLAWGNGDTFFQYTEIAGKPEFVYFGSVRDDRGRRLSQVTMRVTVVEHQLEFTSKTDVLGRYRTVDVGRAIKELGYEVDPSLITVKPEYAGYHVVRRENRGKRRQNVGAVELDFILARDAS